MPSINLDENEWQQILFVLLKTPNLPLTSEVAYTLASKILRQLQAKQEPGTDGRFKSGNSKEVPAVEPQLESERSH